MQAKHRDNAEHPETRNRAVAERNLPIATVGGCSGGAVVVVGGERGRDVVDD